MQLGSNDIQRSSGEFILDAIRTEAPITEEVLERAISHIRELHSIMGLTTEIGELTDIYKRRIFYGAPVDEVHVQEEVGDIFWYLAVLCHKMDVTFEPIMARLIAKLRVRYPLKYADANAVVRDLDAERRALEEARPAFVGDSLSEAVVGKAVGRIAEDIEDATIGTPPDLR